MTGAAAEPADRPLISFVLFAYNQEKFIRDAVAAALAQTYSPLEVVLSDDGSSDRTFSIMEELVKAYSGPHEVRLIRNEPNLGLIQHVMKRGREAKGNYVVVAAGDDISHPERTSLAVAPMLANSEVFATVSLVDIIDESGTTIADNALRPLHFSEPEIFVKDSPSKRLVIQGCCAAYRKEVFAIDVGTERSRYPEDMLFSFYIHSIGKMIEDVDQSLVKYRIHDQAQSNNRGFQGTRIESEIFMRQNSITNIEMFSLFFDIIKMSDFKQRFDVQKLQKAMDLELLIANWANIGFFGRIMFIVRTLANKGKLPWKWMAMRMFGTFPRYQPRLLVAEVGQLLRKRS